MAGRFPPGKVEEMTTETATTYGRVQRIVADILDAPVEEVAPEAHLERDLGADSLDYVEIAMRLEDEFGIQVDEDAAPMVTVREVVQYVEEQLQVATCR